MLKDFKKFEEIVGYVKEYNDAVEKAHYEMCQNIKSFYEENPDLLTEEDVPSAVMVKIKEVWGSVERLRQDIEFLDDPEEDDIYPEGTTKPEGDL